MIIGCSIHDNWYPETLRKQLTFLDYCRDEYMLHPFQSIQIHFVVQLHVKFNTIHTFNKRDQQLSMLIVFHTISRSYDFISSQNQEIFCK